MANNYKQPPQNGFLAPVQAPPIMYQPQLGACVIGYETTSGPVGPSPMIRKCPSCHNQILSHIQIESSMRTHLTAVVLCGIGCWPCAWLPYTMDSCKNTNHYCPACNTYLGTYMG